MSPLAPSPGTPGEGWGEGSVHSAAIWDHMQLPCPTSFQPKLAYLFLVSENVFMNADTRLHDAIRAKDARRVRAAIAAGASLVGPDGGKSALHLAAAVGDENVIEALP